MEKEILGIVQSQKKSNMQKEMNEYGENKKNYMNDLGYTINYYNNMKDLFENIKDDQTILSNLINESKIAEYLLSNEQLSFDNKKDIEKYLKAINEKLLSSENFTFYISEGIEPVINIGFSQVRNDFENTGRYVTIDYIPSIDETMTNKIRLTLSGLIKNGKMHEGSYDILDNGKDILRLKTNYVNDEKKTEEEITVDEFCNIFNISKSKLNDISEMFKQVLKDVELTDESTIKHNI